jgi:hypothetical protein
MGSTKVVNLKDRPLPAFDVYIGDRRAPFMSPTGEYMPRSDWYNPFNKAYRRDAITREESIAMYREYLLSRPDLLERLPELEGKTLACWCKPDACHGDVLLELLQD